MDVNEKFNTTRLMMHFKICSALRSRFQRCGFLLVYLASCPIEINPRNQQSNQPNRKLLQHCSGRRFLSDSAPFRVLQVATKNSKRTQTRTGEIQNTECYLVIMITSLQRATQHSVLAEAPITFSIGNCVEDVTGISYRLQQQGSWMWFTKR